MVLPDHLHCIWNLPEGDDDFSTRWRQIKAAFSRQLPKSERRSKSRVNKGERGIWHRRFWEHAIRDDADYQRHVDYIHYNPVRHEYVARVLDWRYSSFHRFLKIGVYPSDLGRFRDTRFGKRGDGMMGFDGARNNDGVVGPGEFALMGFAALYPTCQRVMVGDDKYVLPVNSEI